MDHVWVATSKAVGLPGPSCSGSLVCHKDTVPGGPFVSSGELVSVWDVLADMTCGGSQEDVVSNWKPAHGLVRDVASGAKIAVASCLLRTCLSASWEGCKWQLALSPLVFARVWYFGKHNRCHSVASEPSHRKCPFFFFPLFLCHSHGLSFPYSVCVTSHSPLRVSSWYSTPVLSLRTDEAARTSTPSPHLPWADTNVWATSRLVIATQRHFCGDFFWLCCPLRFQLTPSYPICWRVSYCVETSPPFQLPPQDGLHPEILFLPFCLYPLSYLTSKRLICLSGYLGSFTSVQKLFCGSCSICKRSDVFAGEKVVTLSYSSTILGPV